MKKSEGAIFEGIIDKNEEFHFTMCNPPFFEDLEEERKIVGWRKCNLTKGEGQVTRVKKHLNGTFKDWNKNNKNYQNKKLNLNFNEFFSDYIENF